MELFAPAATSSPVWTAVLPGCSTELSVAIMVGILAIAVTGILISARGASEPKGPVGATTATPGSSAHRPASGVTVAARVSSGRRAVLEVVQ